MDESTEAPIELEADTVAHTIAGSHTEAADMVESNGAPTSGVDASESTAAPNEIVDTSESTTESIETEEHYPDILMDGAEGMPADALAGSGTAVGNTSESTAVSMEIADASKNTAVPIETADTRKRTTVPTETVEYSPDVSMDGTEDTPGETPAGSEMETPVLMLAAQEIFVQSRETDGAPETAEVFAVAANAYKNQAVEADVDGSGAPLITTGAGCMDKLPGSRPMRPIRL